MQRFTTVKSLLYSLLWKTTTYCCNKSLHKFTTVNKNNTGLQKSAPPFSLCTCKTTHGFSYTSVSQKCHTKHYNPVLVFLHTAVWVTIHRTAMHSLSGSLFLHYCVYNTTHGFRFTTSPFTLLCKIAKNFPCAMPHIKQWSTQ